MKMLGLAADASPSELANLLIPVCAEKGIELVVPEAVFGATDQHTLLKYLYEHGREIADPDLYDALVVFGPASFLSGIEIAGVELFRRYRKRKVIVVADLPHTEGRSAFRGIVPTIDLAIVAKGSAEHARSVGYRAVAELDGLPPIVATKVAAIEKIQPRKDIEVVTPRGVRRPIGTDDRLVMFDITKDGSLNNAVLRSLIEAGRDLFGEKFVLVYKSRIDESLLQSEHIEREVLLRTVATVTLDDASMQESIAFMRAHNGIMCFTGGSTDVFTAALMQIPSIYFTSEANRSRNLAQGIAGSWPPGDTEALYEVDLDTVDVRAVLVDFDSAVVRKKMYEAQRKHFPRSLIEVDTTEEIVHHLAGCVIGS